MTTLSKISSLFFCLALGACVGVDMTGDERSAATASEGGEVSLEWLIVANDSLISCVDAGASVVELSIVGEAEHLETVSCFGGFAVVSGLPSGSHQVEISLLAPDGSRLVSTDFGMVDIVEGATVPLGAIELSL